MPCRFTVLNTSTKAKFLLILTPNCQCFPTNTFGGQSKPQETSNRQTSKAEVFCYQKRQSWNIPSASCLWWKTTSRHVKTSTSNSAIQPKPSSSTKHSGNWQFQASTFFTVCASRKYAVAMPTPSAQFSMATWLSAYLAKLTKTHGS